MSRRIWIVLAVLAAVAIVVVGGSLVIGQLGQVGGSGQCAQELQPSPDAPCYDNGGVTP